MRTKLENIIFGKIGFKNGIKKKNFYKKTKTKIKKLKE
jgi:hypothetical protein